MDVASAAPIDLVSLARQTGGDDRLGREVLRMFIDGMPADLAELRAAATDRRALAHRLVGSARAIGAADVAAAAATLEAGGTDLARLESAMAAARRFIEAYLSD